MSRCTEANTASGPQQATLQCTQHVGSQHRWPVSILVPATMYWLQACPICAAIRRAAPRWRLPRDWINFLSARHSHRPGRGARHLLCPLCGASGQQLPPASGACPCRQPLAVLVGLECSCSAAAAQHAGKGGGRGQIAWLDSSVSRSAMRCQYVITECSHPTTAPQGCPTFPLFGGTLNSERERAPGGVAAAIQAALSSAMFAAPGGADAYSAISGVELRADSLVVTTAWPQNTLVFTVVSVSAPGAVHSIACTQKLSSSMSTSCRAVTAAGCGNG